MQMLNSTQHLVQEVGHPFVIEIHLNNLQPSRCHRFLSAHCNGYHYLTKVGIHQLHNEIYIREFR